ncbi:rhodanese-like domain-containing protein [Sediminitomix flava]|uniref:Rhodanese-related sulfurtransferase n=1 Tax=Sediminitomix flava TaxID=379075 RepID=A0A315Z6I2_SEDFL|nr:rhodanese-like domain-containing protein [Sediminitomix flava]PWJ39264.1 rhodanese-related sulfurtransferase [Sediminitomix flava]
MLDFIKNLFGGGTTGFTELTSDEFEAALKDGQKKMILDVRSAFEFKDQKIHQALNVDIQHPDFDTKLAHFDHEKPVYVYCQSGSRGRKACRKLVQLGYKNIYNLKGGISQYDGKTV